MRYAGIIKNDFAAASGVCVTFFTQGCPHHCIGCHNPETWEFAGGKEFSDSVLEEIDQALTANGVKRDFCIMGGEPLCPENLELVNLLIDFVRLHHPDIKIYIWTGYYYVDLKRRKDLTLEILNKIDVLVDGPFIKELRDTTLKMRGSSNQTIINLAKLREEQK